MSNGHEFDKQLCYVVNRDDEAAWSAMMKIIKNPGPGAIIPLSQEEFDALKEYVLVLCLPAVSRTTEKIVSIKREICAKEECYEPVSSEDVLLCEKHLQEWLK